MVFTLPASAHPGQHERLQQLDSHIESGEQTQALYIQRGVLHTENGSFSAARADLQRAALLGNPAVVDIYLAELYRQQGDLESARKRLDSFIKAFPQSERGYEARARLAMDAGETSAALADLRRYLQLSSRPHPGNYIAAADLMADAGNYQQAVALIDTGLDKLGLATTLQRKAVAMEVAQGNIEQAIARQQTLRVALNDSARWKLDMAELLMQQGQSTRAGVLAEAARRQLSLQRATPAQQALLARANQYAAVP